MATVQISFRDNADNETEFKVYRGTSAPLSSASTQIASVALSGGAWAVTSINSEAHNVEITSTNTGDSVTSGETFVIKYDELVAGDYYYGISASNAIGDSDVVTTATTLTIT